MWKAGVNSLSIVERLSTLPLLEVPLYVVQFLFCRFVYLCTSTHNSLMMLDQLVVAKREGRRGLEHPEHKVQPLEPEFLLPRQRDTVYGVLVNSQCLLYINISF